MSNFESYSKASSYTDLAGAWFLIGSKTFWDTRIYVVKTLSCTFFWWSCPHPVIGLLPPQRLQKRYCLRFSKYVISNQLLFLDFWWGKDLLSHQSWSKAILLRSVPRDRTVVLLVSFRGYIKEIPAAGYAAIAPPPTAQWWDVIDEVCKKGA